MLPLALFGCDRGAVDDSPASAQAKTSAPAAEAGFKALEAAPDRMLAESGRISIPVPSAPGWECLEERNGDAEGGAVALRCRREDPREFMFLAAKTHRQPPDQHTNAKTVLMTVYRDDNERFFEQVEYLRDEAAQLAGADGWEAELQAEHGRIGPVRKRERLAIIGDRVFAISAEGVPALWTQHAETIDQWFDSVEFAR